MCDTPLSGKPLRDVDTPYMIEISYNTRGNDLGHLDLQTQIYNVITQRIGQSAVESRNCMNHATDSASETERVWVVSLYISKLMYNAIA